MRMTDAILPGHTSPGTIKAALTMLSLFLPLLITGSKVRPLFFPLLPADNKAGILFSFPPCWQQGKTN